MFNQETFLEDKILTVNKIIYKVSNLEYQKDENFNFNFLIEDLLVLNKFF